jgi:hypothetical protein
MLCILSPYNNGSDQTARRPSHVYAPVPGHSSEATNLAQGISGWIVATDLSDARRQAYTAGQHALAQELYRLEFEPRAGKHILPSGHVLLAS